ncbi:helix-turn-helix domain-containing protein [Enterococcus faecalis]|uniref:helix-turn-helix domain-containing protein n=1 Tax=Enterococcus faecalis TaxID=1351 RepID=UPI001CF3D3DB|nr:helix-turn-helix transcriptional regulator [Enterococcus faecalis]MCA6777737.1 helix-turn-helix transcriptional regulator [Enterococcus faecalis]HCT6711169.1 helix-turn-helix transcriptional regulator [Enterococcus faecalis]HCT6950300.1 helix-turn-helix transcriptional regulator [Enterococcus faecalis]HCT6953172.1 helix-turn-helix transcriptional regulator [Enterococcus faecalis]HCT6961322.1 helix-turn-helix transcriptional regulator [Enterococcus faecalis]
MSQDLELEVRAALVKAKKTQTWLAEELDLSKPYLTDILKGRRSPENQIKKIKKILNIK